MKIRKTSAQGLFQATGWKLKGAEIARNNARCVVTAAPHTSNWDLLYSLAAFEMLGLPVRFTIKKEWMRWPFNLGLEPLGALAVDRRPRPVDGGEAKRPSMVEAMVQLFVNDPGELAIMVTPEGSRSARDEWKTGFWHVARQAGVPILLGYLDYKKKEAGVGAVIHPNDFETDMRTMMAFYKDVTACHPELFRLDRRYLAGTDGQ